MCFTLLQNDALWSCHVYVYVKFFFYILQYLSNKGFKLGLLGFVDKLSLQICGLNGKTGQNINNSKTKEDTT